MRQAFGLATDAGKLFHVDVPGSDFRVANRPINGDSFLLVGFEIEVAPAVTLAAPQNGFSADLPAANPGKMFTGREGVRIFLVVDEKLVRILIACVVTLPLNRLGALALGAIVPATMLEFPHGNVLDIIALGDDAAARFKDQRIQSFFREFLGGPAAGDSR